MQTELNDTQIALIIKVSLEFNAAIVAQASFIYGQNLKPSTREKVSKEMLKISKRYDNDLNNIIKGEY